MEKDKKFLIGAIALIAILLVLSVIPDTGSQTCTGIRTKDYSYFNMTKAELKAEMGGIFELETYEEDVQRKAKSNAGLVNTPDGVINLTNTVFTLTCK